MYFNYLGLRSNGSSRALGTLVLLSVLGFGCNEAGEAPRAPGPDLSPVIRFTAQGGGVHGRSGLEAISEVGEDVFSADADLFLDDSFTDLENWKCVGMEDRAHASFSRLDLPEGMGGSVLRIRKGLPSKGRLLGIPQGRPVTVCARMKLPPGLPLENVRHLFGVAELDRITRLRERLVTPDQFLGLHFSWQPAAEKEGWIDLHQVFIPKGTTRFILVGFNASSEALDRNSEILVGRVMVRSATVAETAFSLLADRRPGAGADTVPVLRWDAGGELRDSLIAGAPGHVELPLKKGPGRLLRFGVTFPASLSRDHAKRVPFQVGMETPGNGSVVLHREVFELDAPRKACGSWFERVIEIPAVEADGRIVLETGIPEGGKAIVAFGAPTLASPAPPGAPPSVILVSIDTLRADRLGCYGGHHPQGVSPFIDRLACESILFENTVAQAPFTLPSHVSMLSGQYPSVHRVFNREYCIDPARTPLLASLLARAGYVTGAFTGGLLVQHTFGFDEGFDTYFEREPCRGDNLDRVKNWLEASGSSPFFLFFHTYAVHHCAFDDPAYIDRFDAGCTSTIHHFSTAPEWTEWLAQTERHTEADQRCLDNRYAAGIRMSDDALAEIMDLLQGKGLLDRTLLVITSDHGKELLERGNIQHGHTLYEELVRVPLIIRPPGGTAPRRIADLVEVLDIPPTILEEAGIPLPSTIQGMSLSPFLDTRASMKGKSFAFSEVDSTSNKYALRTPEWKIIQNPRADAESGEYELYHLTEDPEESVNLAGSHPAYKQIRDRLRAFRDRLEAMAEALKGGGGKVGAMDPELLQELRAQGYVK